MDRREIQAISATKWAHLPYLWSWLVVRLILIWTHVSPPLALEWHGQPKQPSKYERQLDTDMIGSRTRLPRGNHQLEKDPDFFRSVHLVGEGLAREKEEAKRRTEELWRSKVLAKCFRSANSNMSFGPRSRSHCHHAHL